MLLPTCSQSSQSQNHNKNIRKQYLWPVGAVWNKWFNIVLSMDCVNSSFGIKHNLCCSDDLYEKNFQIWDIFILRILDKRLCIILHLVCTLLFTFLQTYWVTQYETSTRSGRRRTFMLCYTSKLERSTTISSNKQAQWYLGQITGASTEMWTF